MKTGGADDPGPARAGVMATIAGLLLAVIVALVIPRLSERPPAELTANDQAKDLRVEAALLVEEIEAHWEEHRALPEPAVLVPFLDEGYEYQVVDATRGRFVVRRTAAGVTVTYDGSLPLNLWVLVGGQSSGEGSS